jgi:hypothetical protein
MATWGPETEPLEAITAEVTRLAEDTGATEAVLEALTLQGLVGWLTLADADALAADDEYDALAAETKQPAGKWQGIMVYTIRALFQGDFALAERLAEEALRSGEARNSDAECSYRLSLFMLPNGCSASRCSRRSPPSSATASGPPSCTGCWLPTRA